MAIFISKKALDKVPDSFSSTYIPTGRKVLRNRFLKNNPFFVNLARQVQGAEELKIGSIGNQVGSLQLALKVVRELQSGQASNLLITTEFDVATENALKDAQQAFGLPESGILDRETLLSIDAFLEDSGAVFSLVDGTIHYKGSYASQTKVAGSILIENGEMKTGSGFTNKVDAKIAPDGGLINLNIPAEEEGIRAVERLPAESGSMDYIVDVRYANPSMSQNGYFVEQGLIPQKPSGLPPDAKPRTIQEGETLISIIHEEYLKDGYTIYNIPGDSNSGTLFEFPARSLAIEDKDFRIRFLANLIYYMNQDPGISYAIHRSSVAPGVVDYTDVHLDEVNLYDNDTFGLNYKKFVERMNALDNSYDWSLYAYSYTVPTTGQSYTFDAPFSLDVGEDLYLPSREFVESLFLHLNFRPKDGEMYEQKVDAEGDAYFDWISLSGFEDFLDEVRNEIVDAVEEALTVDIYTEAYNFFQTIYGWIIDKINEFWPRSMGFLTGGGANIGLLYGGGVSGEVYVWRKVTPKGDLVFQTASKGALNVNIAGGIGEDIGFGKSGKTSSVGSFKGTKKGAKIGVTAYAGVQGSATIEVFQEHEFPINKENTAILAMMLPALRNVNPIAGGLVDILDFLQIVNIDPFDYMTKINISLEKSVGGGVQLSLGTGVSNESDYGKNESGEYSIDGENSDALNFNNLGRFLRKLDLSFGADLGLNLGNSIEVNYEYDDLPNLHLYDSRMPSKMEMLLENYADIQLDTYATSSDIIQRFILGTLSVVGDFEMVPTFNLDAGMGILCGITYSRTQPSENHIFADYVWQELGISDPNGNIDRFLGVKVYTGDFSERLEPASEVIWNLNIGRLGELIRDNGINPFTNLNEVFEVLGNLELRKRIKFINYETYNAERNKGTFDRLWKVSMPKLHTANYSGPLSKMGLNISSYLEIGAKFDISQAANALQYLFYRAWFSISEKSFSDNGPGSIYLSKKDAIDQAYHNRQQTLGVGSTQVASFFDDLLNDSNYGIKTILEIQPGGESNLPMVTVSNSFGGVMNYLDREGGKFDNKISKPEEKDIIFNKDFDIFWGLISDVLLVLNQVDFKMNSSIYGNVAANFRAAFGARANLSAYFEVGFYDEVLLLDKGNFVLEGINANEDEFYDILLEIMSQITQSDIPIDYSASDISGGQIGKILAFQNTRLNEIK